MSPQVLAPAGCFVPGRPPWWLWPTVLSLDAPAVAIAWQCLLANVAAVTLSGYHVGLLGLSVWLAYSADRWIEGWRLTLQTVRTQRHYFFLRWRWPAFAVWIAVLVFGLGLALHRLTPREWVASLGLLAPTLVYLLSHQLLHRDHPWRVPKEVCVAVIIALGSALYPAALAADGLLRLAGPVMLLLLLALANCLLISDWERAVDTQHGQTSLALRYAQTRMIARWLPSGIALLGLGLAVTHTGPIRNAAACAALSGVLLAGLAWAQPRLGRERSRVLADVVLLTPLLGLAFL